MSDLLYQTLFRDLAGLLTMAPFGPNAAGVCELILNDRIPITLVRDDENDRLLIVGLINLPDDFPPKLLLNAAMNPLQTGGPGLGVDEETGLCMGWQTLLRPTLNAKQVLKTIEVLVQWIEQWEQLGRDHPNEGVK